MTAPPSRSLLATHDDPSPASAPLPLWPSRRARSVLFNFLGRDFFNALSAKDQAKFTEMLFKWLAALCVGIPVFVLRDYYQQRLSLEWREWMTRSLTAEYFEGRTFYQVQAGALVDNPDQRIAVDVR